jgi:putative flippase GtrA
MASRPLLAVALEFIRYGFAGTAALTVHLIVLTILVELTGTPATIASTFGFSAAIPVNYLLQHRFVFGCTSDHHIHFPRYVAATLVTMGVNVALVWLLVDILRLHYLLSQLVVVSAVFLVNFAIGRTFTFTLPDRANPAKHVGQA